METASRCSDLLNNALRNDPKKLHIDLLGGCSLTYGDNIISDQIIRSKKPWLLLEHLICFRSRELSQSELIDVIYPEGRSENPVNALKTLVHRIRAMLDDLHFADSKSLILQVRGSYKWNSALSFDVDIDLFDALYDYAFSSDAIDDERLDCLLAAARLYKGDLLPKSSSESWVIHLSTYYHNRYIETITRACDLLFQNARHADVVDLCQAALKIDAYEEAFYAAQLRALVELGRCQTALTVYTDMTNLFYREFGVTPSDSLTALYRDIIKTINNVETDLGVIHDALREAEELDGAYLCEYEIFKDIYRLEVRAAARSGESAFLCLTTLSANSGVHSISNKALNTNMDRLADSIRASLRRGDVYTKYSISQYLLLLPSLTYENCEMVLSRIVRRFRKDSPNCPLQLAFSIRAIDMKL